MTIPAGNVDFHPFNDMTELAEMVRRRKPVTLAATTTLTTRDSGKLFLLGAADMDVNLPAIGADDVGTYFDFATTVTATDQKIIAQAADLLTGGVAALSTTAGGADAFSPDVSDDLTITMNGTTTGGVIGSKWRLTAISATRWLAEGVTIGSGTLATPFS